MYLNIFCCCARSANVNFCWECLFSINHEKSTTILISQLKLTWLFFPSRRRSNLSNRHGFKQGTGNRQLLTFSFVCLLIYPASPMFLYKCLIGPPSRLCLDPNVLEKTNRSISCCCCFLDFLFGKIKWILC